jgi:hypothetical protein
MTLYNIVRFYAPHINKPNRTILKGLSLEQAQQHCRDPKTRKDGEWFDGFARPTHEKNRGPYGQRRA